MNVSEIGEFGLISFISDLIQKNSKKLEKGGRQLIVGIGDDAAAWKSKNKIELASTDSLVENVHFDLRYITWKELGYKAIAVNLSDIAAMGGIPQYILVSLCIPSNISINDIKMLYQGMFSITNKHGISIIGGNITLSHLVIVNITVLGYSNDNILKRSMARPGDLIAITGYTGLSAAGMIMLQKKLDISKKDNKKFRIFHNCPEPKLGEGKTLVDCGVKSAIDISDGLLLDLKHICEASKVSARVQRELVPVHPLLKKYFKDEYELLVFTGGEDYELLFTANNKVMERVKSTIKNKISIIGKVEQGNAGSVHVVDMNGNEVNFFIPGWDHFIKKMQ